MNIKLQYVWKIICLLFIVSFSILISTITSNFREYNENYCKLGVMSVFKNETMNLKVWIEHYVKQGVSKIFLTDNGSTDDPISILQPYIDLGIVEYTYDDTKHNQRNLLVKMFDKYEMSRNVKWLIECDLDEFVFGLNAPLIEVLNDYEDYDVIYMNWYMFGSNGKNEHPPDIRTELIKREQHVNDHTKYIVKTEKINSDNIEIHFLKNIDEQHVKSTTENNKIRLYHYPIQSREFFEKVKMTRGAADTVVHENVRDWNYFDKYDENANFVDLTLKNIASNGYK